MARQMSLDRIMIGFNGTSYSRPVRPRSEPAVAGLWYWLAAKIRNEAPHRRITGVTITSRDEDNKIIAKGTYGNIGAAVYDAKNSLMDEWHKRNPDNVVILAGDLLTTSNFPTINAMSQTNPNTEMLAGQLIVAQERVGNMPTFIAPYFPVTASSSRRLKTCRSTTSAAACAGRSRRSRNTTAWQRTSPRTMTSLLKTTAQWHLSTASPLPKRRQAAVITHRAGHGPPLFGEETMLTPAQRHFQRVMAERHGKADDLSDTARTAHEQILHRLRMDQSALKRVQSDQAKAAMKRQLLPHYEGWIEGRSTATAADRMR
jgi:hypothetical protein